MDFAKIDRDVLTRVSENPVLTADDFENQLGFKMRAVYNSAAIRTRHADAASDYVMLCRTNQLNHRTLLWGADSADGVNWTLRPQPFVMPDDADWRKYAASVYFDPRITWIDGRYVVLMAVSGPGYSRIALFESEDLTELNFVNYICAPDNRNMVIFPEKIGGRYVRLERPNIASAGGKGNVWLAHSPDLIHWGDWREVLQSNQLWNYAYSGLGPSTVPDKVEVDGEPMWLTIFHAIMNNCTSREYSVGAMLLDYEKPWVVRHVTKHPILRPEAQYELRGLVDHVCFPCAQIIEDDGSVKLYYGGADTVQCVATGALDEIIHACKHW